MRIVLITGSYPQARCGVGDYTAHLANRLSKDGHDIYVLTTDDPSIEVHEGSNPRVIKGIKNWGLTNTPKVLYLLKRINPDIVHIQYPTRGYGSKLLVNLLPLTLKLTLRKSIITTIHEFSQAHIFRKISMLFLFLFSNRVIFTDKNEKKSISTLLNHISGRCLVIPIGPNIEPASRSKSVSSKDGPYIVYFGFPSKTKGLQILLEAFKKVIEHGCRCKLLMITDLSKSPEEQHILDIIEQFKLSDVVTITGYCPPKVVSEYLDGATACVLPFIDGISFRRGTFVAALSHALPTVTTYGEIVPELLENWHNVVLVPKNDSISMADALVKLIYQPDLRKELSINAKKIAGYFSWDIIVSEHARLYRSMQAK